VLTVGLLAIALLYWSLTGWDAKDKAKSEAVSAVNMMSPDLKLLIETTMRESGKIASIKVARAEMNLGLKEAKEIVDELERRNPRD